MGKIDRFLAKPVEVTIGGQKELIYPLTVDDMPLLMKMGDDNKDISGEAMKKVIMKVLKQIDPEATEEQMSKISMEYLTDLMDAIAKVNNLPMEDQRNKLVEKLKQGQK